MSRPSHHRHYSPASPTSSPGPSSAPAPGLSGRCPPSPPASGIVWTGDGLIATANHVVERDEEIGIGLPAGEQSPLRSLVEIRAATSRLLRIDASDLAPQPDYRRTAGRAPYSRDRPAATRVAQWLHSASSAPSRALAVPRWWVSRAIHSCRRRHATGTFSGGPLVRWHWQSRSA